jgi:hypothetical protein
MGKRMCAGFHKIMYLEFLPNRLKFHVKGKPCVFVPMYDNEWNSFWQWHRIAWSGLSVLSYCRSVSAHARRCGVKNILDVQYFPEPSRYQGMAGDPRVVLLWERGSISFDTVKKLFRPDDVKEVRILRRIEENISYKTISEEDLKRWKVNIIETGFVDEDVYFEQIRPAGTVIAPRRKEGIGMSFLEPMAMGKIVVAHNDATMNEYIRDGENGFLFDVDRPQFLDMHRIEKAQQRILEDAVKYRDVWLRAIPRLLFFVETAPPCHPSLWKELAIWFSYPLFVVEAAWYRLRQFINR